jgi:hypothetical protein
MPRGKFKHRYWFFADTANKVYDVKILSHTGTMALLGNNYLFQMTDTGFAEKF